MSACQNDKFYRLNYRALQIGDVIVEIGDTGFAKVIRAVEQKPFTHALICISAAQVVEAVTRGVVFLSAARIVTREPERYRQLRHPGLTGLQKGAIEGTVRGQAFKNYSLRGAIGTKLAPIRTARKGAKFFCSELVTAAYAAAGIVLVPGRNPASITPNVILNESVLTDVTSPNLFEEIPVFSEEDRLTVEAMLDRDKNIKGTEIDENRQIEQDMMKAYRTVFQAGYNYPDGKRRRLYNLAEMLRALTEMNPNDAKTLSDRLNASLKSTDYFHSFDKLIARSQVFEWVTEMALLWASGRQTEAMAVVERAYEVALLYRVTAKRLRDDAAALGTGFASGLSVMKSFREMLIRNTKTLEAYCEEAEKFKRLKDMTFGSSPGLQ